MKRTLLLLALLMTGLSHAQTNEEVEIIEANTGLSYEQAVKIYVHIDFASTTTFLSDYPTTNKFIF